MNQVLVFVPATPETWREVLTAPSVEAFAPTAELRAALGYDTDQDEDAEHAAMVLASVAGLARHGTRFVLACEVPEQDLTVDPDHADTPNGRVVTGPVAPTRVLSWFADEPEVDPSAAAGVSHGLSLDDAWDTPEVAEVVDQHALLWHAAEELTALTASQSLLPTSQEEGD